MWFKFGTRDVCVVNFGIQNCDFLFLNPCLALIFGLLGAYFGLDLAVLCAWSWRQFAPGFGAHLD